MRLQKLYLSFFILFIPLLFVRGNEKRVVFSCDKSNNLYTIIQNSKLDNVRYDSPSEAISNAHEGDVVLILANKYPEELTQMTNEMYRIIGEKNIKTFIEFPSLIPNIPINNITKANKERAVNNSNQILGINGLHYISLDKKIDSPFIVAAKVAGFDTAIYGLPEKTEPLLFSLPDSDILISTTSISNFVSGRYAPQREWGEVWENILKYLMPDTEIGDLNWNPELTVTYRKEEKLPANYQKKSIKNGIEWYRNAKILIDESYSDSIQELVDKGIERIEWSKNIPSGNGSYGSIECVVSEINENGGQPLGLIVRGDCVSETAMAYALSGKVFNDKEYNKISQNLMDFYLINSIATKNEYGNPNHAAYGLIPWGISNDLWYKASYGDDNARFFLASIVTSAITKTDRWNEKLMKSLLSLLRSTGKNGFRGSRIDLKQFEENGWEFYQNREILNLSPHFEAYLWACYIWAYNQTGDELFLEKAEKGINIMMENYPDKLVWTNGLAQERARMLLPLAWLVQVRNTPENRKMLIRIVDDVLNLQDESGAIREELGSLEMGKYPPPKSNEAYGTNEASLIAKNGDPVSDLLYTTNFAFLGLHEASYVLKDPKLKKAVDKLAEFLCRIQVSSKKHPELHGGWMRAFDYDKFEHWGSNADSGWGAWVIESGWTQGWITSILALREIDTSIWKLTEHSEIEKNYSKLKEEMLLTDK
ncbi:MAG: hypothetical protein WCR12_05135 [Dysgonamonadaceae bacterium]